MLNSIEALPPLRQVIADGGLNANKRLGQNFILDLNLTRKIARQLGDVPADATILEIGPGPGGLTRALLLETSASVIAIEKDARAVRALQPLVSAAQDRLTVLEGDALELMQTLNPLPRYVAANLPYNIGTAILVDLLQHAARLDALVLMFQREVADRLVAAPRSKAYGRLSVLAQALCRVERCFDVPPSAFVPAPSVISSVVRLTPLPGAAAVPVMALSAITQAAFGQRRKMLRASLAGMPELVTTLTQAGREQCRAEELSVAEFVALATLQQL